jgi:hypothetical protein
LEQTYRGAGGRGGAGPKLLEGDNRTPEGLYRVVRRFPSRKYHRFLLLSYPNDRDRRAFQQARRAGRIPSGARIGGQIGIHGEKRGRDLGYRTANMRLDPATGLAHGIYAVRVRLDDGRLVPGVASFGRRPHFDNGAPLLETHLFDFDGDLYGRNLEVIFVSYLRGEAKFDSLDALIAQMDADSVEAKKRLAALAET